MSERPLHDWMVPRLNLLLQQAEQAGFARAPCVAVIADIMMSPSFNDAPPPIEPLTPPVAPHLPPLSEDWSAPSLGATDWIKPTGVP